MKPISAKKKQLINYTPFLFSLVGFTLCYVFALQFEIYEGGADNYIHYRVSRYAFTYPELFLDHWGKPVFTLLSAPFAQFGFHGLVFFNVLCGVLASFFTYRVAQLLQFKEAWAAFVFVLAMPVYYIMMVSAMTEVLFSFLLIFAIYLFLKEKYVFSSVIFSLLFLVRTEGYIFYPFIAFVFLYKKQWKAIPFLLTGFLFYSVIGWFYFSDFFWLINQNPYGDATDIYGTGELLFFVKKYKEISGKPLGILLFIGVLIASFQSLKLLWKEKKLKVDFILIEGLFIIYFAAHSYVWWSGTGASAGLIRVMAAIVPLMAISSLRTVDFFAKFNPLSRIYYSGALAIISIYLLYLPIKHLSLPYQYGEREKTIAASIDWLKQSPYKNVKVYFYEPLVYFLLDRNPFDHSVIKELIDDREHPENSVKEGEIVFYDMHFGPNEGRLPLNNLMDNPKFELVNYFEPLNEMIVLGGYKYGMLLFKRVANHSKNNHELLQKFIESKSTKTLFKTNLKNKAKITKEEFTPLLEMQINEIKNFSEYQILLSELRYSLNQNGEILLVTSIEKNGEAKIYNAVAMEFGEKILFVKNSTILNSTLDGSEVLKIYIWNKSKITGEIENFNVSLVKKTY